MEQKAGLATIVAGDIEKARSMFDKITLEAGQYRGKLLGFTEEDTYNLMNFEIEVPDDEGNTSLQEVGFFYNWYLRNSDDLNADVIAWIKSLATIKVEKSTTMLDIANSAIGSTYVFEVYNYVSKSGKSKGETQHSIDFTVLPIIDTTVVKTETVKAPEGGVKEDDLPF